MGFPGVRVSHRVRSRAGESGALMGGEVKAPCGIETPGGGSSWRQVHAAGLPDGREGAIGDSGPVYSLLANQLQVPGLPAS